MVSTGSGGGYLQGPALPRVFVFKMGNTVLSAASRRVQLETVQKEHRCDQSREKAPIQEAITWAGIPYPWERDTQEHYKVRNVKQEK